VNSAAGGSGGSAGPAASDLHKAVPAAAVAPEQRKVFQLAVGLKAPTNAPTTLAAQGIVPKPKALPSKLKPRPAGPSAADAAASKAVLAKLLRGAAEQPQQADASAAQQSSMSAEPAGGSNSVDGTHTQQLVSPPAQTGGSLPEWCLREEAYLAGTLLDPLPPQPSSPLASTPTSSRLPIASPFQQQQTQRAAPLRQPSDPRLGASTASPSSVPWRPGGWQQQQQQQQQAGPGNAGVPYTAASAAPAVPALKQEAGLPLRDHSLLAPAQPAPVQYPQQQPAAQPGHSTLKPPSWAMQQQWPAGQASGLAVLGRGIPPAAQQPQQQLVAGVSVQRAAVATKTRVPAAAFAPLTAAAVVAVKRAKRPDTLLSRRWVSLSCVQLFAHWVMPAGSHSAATARSSSPSHAWNTSWMPAAGAQFQADITTRRSRTRRLPQYQWS
jgi:hypothetical protein